MRGKGNKRQIHGIQHQFNGHKNDDGVAPLQDTGHADAEQKRAQQQIVDQRHRSQKKDKKRKRQRG
jgi:hypothetical protein